MLLNTLKLFVIIFLLSSFLVNGQTYDFNILTTYSVNREDNNKIERNVFSNKKNNNYFLELSLYNNKTKARIFDLESHKVHNFEVLETENSNKEKQYDFNYIDSQDQSTYVNFPEVYYDYKIIESDSIYKKIELTFYTNKRKKKVSSVLELKLKINEFNLFPVFRFSCLHRIGFDVDLNIKENGIIESGFVKSENVNTTYTLTHFEEVDFKLIVN